MNKCSRIILLVALGITLGACAVQSQADDVDQKASLADDGQIFADQPEAGMTVTSKVLVSGHARGDLFFEAVLPVDVVDEGDNIVGEGAVRAEGDWMTQEFVPFQGEIAFTLPDGVSSAAGAVVFLLQDMSGLSEDVILFSVPVTLSR